MPPREGSASSVRAPRGQDAPRTVAPMTGDTVEPHRARQRVSDAQREQAAEIVQAAVSDGRLGLDEIDERLSAVVAARTRGDLELALTDLAGVDDVLTPAEPEGPVVIDASGSATRRDGPWIVPAQLLVRSSGASVELDLTEATFTAPTCHIELDVAWSSVQLIVPDDVVVDADGVAVTYSSVAVKRPRRPLSPRVRVHLTGTLNASSLGARGPGWWRRRALRRAQRRAQRQALPRAS